MSITVNTNYVALKNNKAINFNKTDNDIFKNTLNEANEKKITDEEDKILFESLKNAGVDLVNHSLDWQKEHITAFPPLTAPGSIRRAWREALSNIPQEQRGKMSFNANILFNEEMKREKKVIGTNNNADNFSKAAEYMLDKNDAVRSFIGEDNYEMFKKLINDFKSRIMI